MKIKIAKYLSECGIASRRKSEELVKQGRVFVNGEKMTNVAERIDPQKDKVKVFGKQAKPQKHVYYLLYKPVGYITTTKDPHAEKIITELVPNNPPVWPVGRLDKNTSGLIILTNDGELTQELTHPKYQKEKEYSIITNELLDKASIERVQNGIRLTDGFIKPSVFEEIEKGQYKMVLTEGRKRIVRRIIEAVGRKIAQLKRVRLDSLTLDNLSIGSYRELTKQEVEKLINS